MFEIADKIHCTLIIDYLMMCTRCRVCALLIKGETNRALGYYFTRVFRRDFISLHATRKMKNTLLLQ